MRSQHHLILVLILLHLFSSPYIYTIMMRNSTHNSLGEITHCVEWVELSWVKWRSREESEKMEKKFSCTRWKGLAIRRSIYDMTMMILLHVVISVWNCLLFYYYKWWSIHLSVPPSSASNNNNAVRRLRRLKKIILFSCCNEQTFLWNFDATFQLFWHVFSLFFFFFHRLTVPTVV